MRPREGKFYLAVISEKILFDNSDYGAPEDAVIAFAKEEGISDYEVEQEGMQYPVVVE